MTGLSDSFSRPIDYLRISVTDRCNLRCRYCLPEEGTTLLSHSQILSFEEITLIARAAVELGITKVRLTGGEPLVRRHLPVLVKMLSELAGIDDLSLTTNGILLSRFAKELKAAGLKRVNVSLDSLKPEKFNYITRRGQVEKVLRGIQAARDAGLEPVKINMVVLRGVNNDEILDFARRTIDDGWHVRFIELMPFNQDVTFPASFVPASEIRDIIEKQLGQLEACLPPVGNGPATYFRLKGAKGTLGFITPISEHFCTRCNRLRLTASGRLRTCLLNDTEIDLVPHLRGPGSLEDIKNAILGALQTKPESHRLASGVGPGSAAMSKIGG